MSPISRKTFQKFCLSFYIINAMKINDSAPPRSRNLAESLMRLESFTSQRTEIVLTEFSVRLRKIFCVALIFHHLRPNRFSSFIHHKSIMGLAWSWSAGLLPTNCDRFTIDESRRVYLFYIKIFALSSMNSELWFSFHRFFSSNQSRGCSCINFRSKFIQQKSVDMQSSR